ncbi:thymidylate synthase (FAD), partial [Burkholderia multivorans]
LIRHRAGSAFSQESLRYVRLADIPFWFPDWAREDPELMERSLAVLDTLEEHQKWMAEHFGLDEEGTKFAHKKHMTSFMRRFAPEGLATGIVYTANLRSLRHVIEMRTAKGAEEEIRLVFNKIGEIMQTEAPAIFSDYEIVDGEWIPGTRKA